MSMFSRFRFRNYGSANVAVTANGRTRAGTPYADGPTTIAPGGYHDFLSGGYSDMVSIEAIAEIGGTSISGDVSIPFTSAEDYTTAEGMVFGLGPTILGVLYAVRSGGSVDIDEID